jgi:hypothetical protein
VLELGAYVEEVELSDRVVLSIDQSQVEVSGPVQVDPLLLLWVVERWRIRLLFFFRQVLHPF